MSTKTGHKYRLVTRADFDGLVCASLLKELDLIEDVLFVHPKDMSDGVIEISERDITTNLPYDERCYLAFDHHASEALKQQGPHPANLVLDPEADSAARVVYRYYGGREKFPRVSLQMMTAVDKADSARFTREEILEPSGWVLMNFLMDPRTGLGRFQQFRISNWDLLSHLIDYCRVHTVEEILALPDVRERVELYFKHMEPAQEQLQRCSALHGNVVVLDLRDESTIYCCNRFMIYALHPKCASSIHVVWGRGGRNTVFAIGHSIFNRTSTVNIGELCLRYGGGGHAAAGTCQVDHHDADRVLGELIEALVPPDDVSVLIAGDDEADLDLDLDDPGTDRDIAEEVLLDTMSGAGMHVLPTRQDIERIHERLDRIEEMIAQLATVPSTH